MALAWFLPIESDASDILEQVAAKGAIVPILSRSGTSFLRLSGSAAS
jgi:hypothetical protein